MTSVDDLDDAAAHLAQFQRSEPVFDSCREVSTKEAWLDSFHRGCLAKSLNDKPRIYSQARELPCRNIPAGIFDDQPALRGSEVTQEGPSLSGLESPTQAEAATPQIPHGVLRSAVILEDFSLPPQEIDAQPPLLFSFDEFFTFLLSDKWEGPTSLRIVDGQLLERLLTTFYTLERTGQVNTHWTHAFLRNRRPNPAFLENGKAQTVKEVQRQENGKLLEQQPQERQATRKNEVQEQQQQQLQKNQKKQSSSPDVKDTRTLPQKKSNKEKGPESVPELDEKQGKAEGGIFTGENQPPVGQEGEVIDEKEVPPDLPPPKVK
ncbi:uncharacterized protein LOC101864346 [Aplysia californica]|uniref:Uncharacterized protein LOC101864346 n=1 Tax=Aplysia californica TaxID=6500 RepID=A0ABM0JAC3_APLCA|nr:uncharacterized protein LOC101864346 [Aplysia californica]